jgi:hypothetical protein
MAATSSSVPENGIVTWPHRGQALHAVAAWLDLEHDRCGVGVRHGCSCPGHAPAPADTGIERSARAGGRGSGTSVTAGPVAAGDDHRGG